MDWQDLCRFRSQDDVSYTKVLQSLRNMTSGLGSSVVDEVEVQTLSPVEHEVLESLENEDTSANIRDASPGTCDWILKHDTFKSWLAKPSLPLWVTGKPGSGKSTLMKHITEVCRLGHTSSQAVVSYFFSASNSNHSMESLLSSLLHQLLKTIPSTRSFETFSKFHQRREHEISENARDIDILIENLLLLTDKSTAQGDSIFFIIDALDECEDPDSLVTLLQRLNDFNSSRKLWICISSQPRNLSIPGTEIRMEDNNSPGIQRYLGERLLALEGYLSPTSDVKQTTQVLAEKANGTFLWVSLITSLLRCNSHLQIPTSEQHSTSWLPPTIDAAYETIIRQLWSRHDKSRREIARDAFTLVLCAQRPLSILELRSALAAMHYDSDLLSPQNKSEVDDWGLWNRMSKIQEKASADMITQVMLLCGGLLEVVHPKWLDDTTYAKSTVQFIHQSARGFLQERGSSILGGDDQTSKLSLPELKLIDLRTSDAKYHFRVASICLMYVDQIYMRCNNLNTQNPITSAIFLEYSLSFGMTHLSLAEKAGVNPMKEEMCHLSPFENGFVSRWSSLHSKAFKNQKLFDPHKTKAVHIMSYYGLPWHGTGLWGARLAEINEEDHCGRTPLSLASAMGHHHICEILLDNGADIGYRDYVYGQTPLSHAAAHGHTDVVKLLLSKGSDYDDIGSGVTPLWLATRSGHLEIIQLLLEAGANPNASSIHTGEACLSHAASLGHIRAAHLLLDRGAEVSTRDKNGWTPLHHAVSQGRKRIIELLLGLLKSQELFKLKDDLSKGKVKGSWINAVLTAIVVFTCYKRGGDWQTSRVGNQNRRALNTCSDGRLLPNQGTSVRKHKLGAEKDDEDDEEEIKVNSKKRPRRSSQNGKRFACPYHKKNRAKFPSGACNGKGFQNIDRLKTHLKDVHDLSADWRRCHICKVRFRRQSLNGHSPCEEKHIGDDYEEGYDLDQAQDLKSDRTRPSKNSSESCWNAIFRLLFPDWPANQDTPDPYQADAETTCLADVVQQLRNRVMDRNTISQLYACSSEDELGRALGLLIGHLESDSGHTTMMADNLPRRPVAVMSEQPTITIQHPRYQPMPVPQTNPIYGRSQLYTPAVSSSDANSSRFYEGHDQSDMITDSTALSDQLSTGFDSFRPHQGISSNSQSQFQQQLTLSLAQQPTNDLSHHPESDFTMDNQGITSNDYWINFLHDSHHQPQPVLEEPVECDLQLGDLNEEGNPDYGTFPG
ncbi:hypothetical protein ACHAPO_007360 [Fusarium lateritium]